MQHVWHYNLFVFGIIFFFRLTSTVKLFGHEKILSDIPDEKWGYHDVRENAHTFWWFYGAESVQRRNELPLILWLQGGPGGSGAGFGNFAELGPLDVNLQPRNTTWLKKANLLFIDNPVGAGFSYVTTPSAYTTNATQIAEDLFATFSYFLNQLPTLQTSPFYIFCESYGGKMTAVFADRLYKGIKSGEIISNFKGVALGDSWISPIDSVITWGPYLYQYNLLDEKDLKQVMSLAKETSDAVDQEKWLRATDLWSETEQVIDKLTDSVNVYNVLQHHAPPFPKVTNMAKRRLAVYYQQSLADLMNGPIRQKLDCIPDDVHWGSQSEDVFKYQSEDFMKPVVTYLDKLLSYGLKVTVFQGQLDMICDTPGAERWISKLTWPDIEKFKNTDRVPLYVSSKQQNTQAFLKSYGNFSLFYIMNAGHMVPADNGEMALEMISRIISE